jgi:hypothetical protein
MPDGHVLMPAELYQTSEGGQVGKTALPDRVQGAAPASGLMPEPVDPRVPVAVQVYGSQPETVRIGVSG